MKMEITKQNNRKLIAALLIRLSLLPVCLGALLLIPAGTFDYWQVYVYFAVLVIPMIPVLIYFLKTNPQFLERRAKGIEKEKQQKIFSIFSTLIFLAGFILPGLDRRFGWSHVPFYIVIIADVLIVLGYVIVFFVFKQNSYASRIIEVDEKQEVISTGLYGIVRHPMYVGVLIMFIPAPVALGSYWGLIPFALFPVFLVLRILNEEKVLKENLPGYKEYCTKTKNRLIPFIW